MSKYVKNKGITTVPEKWCNLIESIAYTALANYMHFFNFDSIFYR
jgi:hypothetical protein